jgi:CRP-like cAMP-binding protein
MPELLHTIGPVDRIARTSLFAGIPREGVGRILERARRCYYKAGETILSAGDIDPVLYFVEAGLVFLSPSHNMKDPAGARLVESGDAVNQRAYLCGDPAQQRAVAAMPSIVIAFNRRAVAHVEPVAVSRKLMVNAMKMLGEPLARAA